MDTYSYTELETERRYKRLLAFAKCIKASQDGDSFAKYELAEFYEKGDVCKNDINKAFLLLQEAAMDGFISANFRLGVSYIDGRLGYQDYSKAVKHLMLYVDTIKNNDGRLSCKDENQFRETLILLAEMYKEGCGVEPSNEVFEEFLSRLQVGCGTIGDWYYYGDRFYAITINRTKARKWYEWSWLKGENRCLVEYAKMCMCGEGGVKDFERAIRVLTVAAKNDNLKAMIELAQLYEKNGDFKNTERSLFWRQRSEERAREVLGKKLDSKACLEIAQIFKSGKYVDTWGFLRSDGYQEITDVWSGTGCADMCYSLAKSSSDEKEKISWLLRASLLENVYAQIDLANYYLYEAKLAGNAAYWYYRVAENGLAEGQWMFGVLLELGLGVGKDLHRAVDFYKKAALSGYVRAMVRCILLTMSNKICYDDSIVKIFDELSSSNDVEVLTILGDCYKIGFYVDKDITKAKELYETASKEGSGYAAFRVCEILELEGADIRKELEELSRFGCGEAYEKLGDIKWERGEEDAAIIDYWRSMNYGYLDISKKVCSKLEEKERAGGISFSDMLKYEEIKAMFERVDKSGVHRYNLSLLDFQMKSLVQFMPKDIDNKTDIFDIDKPYDKKRYFHLDDCMGSVVDYNADNKFDCSQDDYRDWAEESGWNDMYGGGCGPSDFIDYD